MITSKPFVLRSNEDLLLTFSKKDRESVILPKNAPYPFAIQHYYTWSEPSGTFTYLVYRDAHWETPRGIVMAKNGPGLAQSPAEMCDWCHHCGPSDQVGLLTTRIDRKTVGGTWLCIDLSCIEKALTDSSYGKSTAASTEKKIKKICSKISEFYGRLELNQR